MTVRPLRPMLHARLRFMIQHVGIEYIMHETGLGKRTLLRAVSGRPVTDKTRQAVFLATTVDSMIRAKLLEDPHG